MKSRLLKIPIVKVIDSTIKESGNHDIGQRAAVLCYHIHISAAFGIDSGFWIFLTVNKSAECVAEFCRQ